MDKSGHRNNPSAKAKLEPITAGMKIGLFGGSFNPAHMGHLHVAETARKRLGLHRVLWLVSPGNPLKGPQAHMGYQQRLASAKAITANIPNQFVCESEQAFGTRYSIDTIKSMQHRWPDVDFVWLIGADNLANFHLWRDWQQIAKIIAIAVIARPGDPLRARLSPFARQFSYARIPDHGARSLAASPTPAWVYLNAPYSDLSSTAIRHLKDLASLARI